MPDTFTFEAAGLVLTAGVTSASATCARRYDFGEAPQKRRSAQGRYGSVPVGAADYEDRTITFSIERPGGGGGEAASRAWLASWQRMAGAVGEVENGTLTHTTATGKVVRWSLLTMRVVPTAQGSVLWHRGYGRAEVTCVALGVGVGDVEEASGTIAATAIGGLPVWRADEAIKGDIAAPGVVEVAWADSIRDVRLAVADAMPLVLEPAATMSTWDAGPSEFGVEAVAGPAPRKLAPVATYTSPVEGRHLVALRGYAVSVEQVEPVALMIDGRVVAYSSIEAWNGAGRQWRCVEFGAQVMRSGSTVQILMGSPTTAAGTAEGLLLTPASGAGAALATIAGEDLPTTVVNGDEFPLDAELDGLDGRAGVFGGEWVADAGWVTENGEAFSTVGSPQRARLDTEHILGASAASCTLDVSIATYRMPTFFSEHRRFGLFTSTGQSIALHELGSTAYELRLNAGSGGVAVSHLTLPVAADEQFVFWNFRFQIDEGGRVSVWAGPVNGRMRAIARLQEFAFVGKTIYGAIDAEAGAQTRIRGWIFRAGESLPYDETVRWAPGPSSRTIEGGTPRFVAGSRPWVIARHAFSEIDSPGASSDPTSYSVSYTPLYLSVPGD